MTEPKLREALAGVRVEEIAARPVQSVSAVHGAEVLAIVLTGMGEDGASALPALRERGGRVWAQDPKTAVVSGMPNAAIATGTVERVPTVDRIAAALANLPPKDRAK